jgi:hypothetical protein
MTARRRRILMALPASVLLGAGVWCWHFPGRHAATPPPPAAAAPALRSIAPPAEPADPAPELRPAVADAVVRIPAGGWAERLDRVRALPADLSSGEVDSLLAALMEPRPAEVSTALHSSFVHEVACALQRQPAVRQRFAETLATIARDPRRDGVTRDYAIQHLRLVWDAAGESPALRESVVSTFREFAGLEPVVAAPALLSLHLLGSGPEGGGRTFHLPDAEFPPLLVPILTHGPAPANLPARLTAARAAGERRLGELRGPLLAILTNPAEHAMIRMAAANALGRIADPADLAKLASYDPGDDRVATAIRNALPPAPGR